MNLTDVPGSSVEQLTAAYQRAASAHGQATAAGDHEAANRHHDLVAAIYRELRSRGLLAQKALLPLMQDPDDAVRSWAASHALEFSPEQAEPVLIALAESRGISAFNAKMTLREWRKGNLSFPS
jgi:hypothetical protein